MISLIFLAVNINSFAMDVPTILAKVCVPPAPGIKLQYVYGNPKRAPFVAILISVFKANSKPPPNAGPSMIEITGQ